MANIYNDGCYFVNKETGEVKNFIDDSVDSTVVWMSVLISSYDTWIAYKEALFAANNEVNGDVYTIAKAIIADPTIDTSDDIDLDDLKEYVKFSYDLELDSEIEIYKFTDLMKSANAFDYAEDLEETLYFEELLTQVQETINEILYEEDPNTPQPDEEGGGEYNNSYIHDNGIYEDYYEID